MKIINLLLFVVFKQTISLTKGLITYQLEEFIAQTARVYSLLAYKDHLHRYTKRSFRII